MGNFNASRPKSGPHKLAIQVEKTTSNGQIEAIGFLRDVLHMKIYSIQHQNPIFNFDNHSK